MSESAVKLLNGAVLAALLVAAGIFVTQRVNIGPPDDSWFQMAVIDRQQPVLVKFGADWCGPCRMLEGELDQVASGYQGRVAVVRIDIDKHPELARHYRVSSIPRLLLFQNGQIVGDRVGYANHQQLSSWVASRAQP